jgi:hypothetical protein
MNRGIEAAAFKAIHSIEEHQRFVAGCALLDRTGQQVAGALDVSSLERIEPPVQQFLRFALPFSNRLPCALDVGTGAIMIAIQKRDARPDVDRLFVIFCEVMIEPGDEKFLDARGAPGI